MFKKTSSDSKRSSGPAEPAGDAPRRAAGPLPASFLGPGLVYDGRISGEGELHVEGTVRGEIEVARLVVGETACVEGRIRGDAVEIRGRVVGDIEAKAVRLHESAHVVGDIAHQQLAIEPGAFFEGRCQHLPRAVAPPALQVIELEKTAQA